MSADGLLLNLQALQQLRESLKPKFESVDTDGGTPIVFELPNGEKLTYNSDMSCSTKVRNGISYIVASINPYEKVIYYYDPNIFVATAVRFHAVFMIGT